MEGKRDIVMLVFKLSCVGKTSKGSLQPASRQRAGRNPVLSRLSADSSTAVIVITG